MFKNGIVMKFIPGKALTHKCNLTPKIEEMIAQKFALMHSKLPAPEEFIMGGPDKSKIMSKYV